MKALIVVESYFGNTDAIARAVAKGLAESPMQVDVVAVSEVSAVIPGDVTMLLIGVPTHARGLSTAKTRSVATSKGGTNAPRGVREWLEDLVLPGDVQIAVFATVSGPGWMSGSAAKEVAKILSSHHPGKDIATQSFRVKGMIGPLTPGQADSARTWGQELGRRRAK